MESKKEIKGVFKFTNNEGAQIFGEGDDVICRTEDGRRYVGRIVAVGNSYQENGEIKHEEVVCIGTFKDNISFNEIIKIADITSMCRIPAEDEAGYPETNEVLDRDKFLEMIVGLGHDKEKAKIMYERMKKFIALYNIPLSLMLVDVIRETDLGEEGKDVEGLVDLNKKFLVAMADVFQSITSVIKEVWIPSIDSKDIEG